MQNPYIEKLRLLEDTSNPKIKIEISHRGGHYGISADHALELIGATDKQRELYAERLPNNIGAYCNYLGGGLRGAIGTSADIAEMTTRGIPKTLAKKMVQLMDACATRYEELENETGLNSETDEDGATNWEACGTNANRRAGILSAY